MSAAVQDTVARVASGNAQLPRVLAFVVVKRNVPLAGRSYGHWWVEVDGTESYGWWPGRRPLRLWNVFLGTVGVLNGMGITNSGTPTRDPNHGLPGDYEFHPVLVVPRTDDEVREHVRRFAWQFRGDWQWSTRPTMNCRLFQLAMFDAVGLVDGTGNYKTRGTGCPALAAGRRMTSRLTGKRRWPGNLPRPGQRVAELLPVSVGADTTPTPSARRGRVALAGREQHRCRDVRPRT